MCIFVPTKKATQLNKLKFKIMTTELKIAIEITLVEFCDVCKSKGFSVEKTKSEILANMDAIVERAKQIQG